MKRNILRKNIILFIFFAIIVVLVIIIINNFVGTRKKIDISKIDMEGTSIPTTWYCEKCDKEVIVLNWDYTIENNPFYYRNYQPGPFSQDPNNDVKVIYWIDKNTGIGIELGIVDYKFPIVAEYFYSLNNPKNVYKKIYWNFSYAKQNITPKDWKWKNTNADDSIVLCGDGNEENCMGWFYQARYGQYYVLIHINENTNYQMFEEIVRAINEEFNKKITYSQ